MQNSNFTASVTFILIALNVVVSLVALYSAPSFLEKGMLKPYRVVREQTWYELFTSGFLHAGLAHLFFNMFTLYFFGRIMEHILGPANFLGLYLSALVISGIPSLVKFRNDPDYATLGASGAVGGVVFAFIFLFPFQDIYIFIIPVGIPAIIFGLLFLIYSMFASNRGGGRVNHEAHIAGAIWGIIYLILFVPHAYQHFLRAAGLS
jgi:membrane associated rhomboid family serine protease